MVSDADASGLGRKRKKSRMQTQVVSDADKRSLDTERFADARSSDADDRSLDAKRCADAKSSDAERASDAKNLQTQKMFKMRISTQSKTVKKMLNLFFKSSEASLSFLVRELKSNRKEYRKSTR